MKSTKPNIERWQFAVLNCSIGDDLMEDFVEVFLERYKWQAEPTPCPRSSPVG